ncbi:hypothetical protein [Methylomonas sp. HYX-M1]|uniref:hypothetical protein n=1 Tax=Methylomonas sp. HYX-M1 TaxID=3139307 RepID=UPI00345C0C63
MAKAASFNPHIVIKTAISGECRAVGMIRGQPPALHFEDHYRTVLDAVRANKKRGAAFVEIALLKTAMGNRWGGLYENNW